jgi:hypothetical protein
VCQSGASAARVGMVASAMCGASPDSMRELIPEAAIPRKMSPPHLLPPLSVTRILPPFRFAESRDRDQAVRRSPRVQTAEQ